MTRTERKSGWIVWLVVAGYLLIAHGCHSGDHDTELFTRFREWMQR